MKRVCACVAAAVLAAGAIGCDGKSSAPAKTPAQIEAETKEKMKQQEEAAKKMGMPAGSGK